MTEERKALAQLREYRELRRRRDRLILQARNEGHSTERIAQAVGMGVRNVGKIQSALLRPNKQPRN